MRKILVVLFLFSLALPTKSFAQSFRISGQLVCESESIEFVQILLQPIGTGVVGEFDGFFQFENLKPGTYSIVVSAIGFKRKTIEVNIENKNIDLGEIELVKDLLGLDEVVISASLKETYVLESPVKVDVITSNFLEQTTMPTNIVEGISLINGVQEVVACGVCFTNSISINGLPGPYTAVLVDGTPIYGNLASVYGLNGIPRQMIERFEIIKGPNSTLYGSEAMAGVINIITKDPGFEPRFSVDLMATSHAESFGNISFAKKNEKVAGFVGLNYAYINDFDDQNFDGFGDNINMDRISLFTKWDIKRKSKKTFNIAAKYYYEDRRNGVEDYLTNRAYRTLRGSEDVYGESIYTKRFELFGKYEFDFSEDFYVNYSFSQHDQDSYYGSDWYAAKQQIGFLNFIKSKSIKNHELLFGATLRAQFYDDNTIATKLISDNSEVNNPEKQFIPGFFVQDEFDISEKLSVLAGYRIDHYNKHGLIGAPRLSAKLTPRKDLTLRANFGTGFRVVNLFAEDHAFITGQREVVITEDILPERSLNGSLNASYQFVIGESQGTLEADLFFTHFTNKIIPDYSVENKIIYENTNGFARSNGLGISWTHALKSGFRWTIGGTLQDAYEVEFSGESERRQAPIMYTSNWSANSILIYTFKSIKLDLAYTARYFGPMNVPLVFDLDKNGEPVEKARPTITEPFALHNFQLTKRFSGKSLKIYLGLQNMLNYQQAYSPLVGFNDPNAQPGFSDYFDTAYAYSPIHGRELYFGFIWALN